MNDLFGNKLNNGDVIVESRYSTQYPAIVIDSGDKYLSIVYLCAQNIRTINKDKSISIRNIYINHGFNICKQVLKIKLKNLSKEYVQAYDLIYKQVKQID